ncbi:MAG: hypothetical protein O7C61_08610 [SAR324 cluster bacterium]|nr:hypothetical protein [SAR324 cluster bacterium]
MRGMIRGRGISTFDPNSSFAALMAIPACTSSQRSKSAMYTLQPSMKMSMMRIISANY